jgi:hypothetical protein
MVDRPSAVFETAYDPNGLIVQSYDLFSDSATILSGQTLTRGALLGKRTTSAAASAAKAGGNTGTGTFVLDATTPILANAEPGIYTLRCITAGANSATFRLSSPTGRVLKDFSFNGSGATVTTDDQIKGVITDGGTDFIVGDGFDITISGDGKMLLSAAAAVDGSQTPIAILADDVDASGGDVAGAPIFRAGGFNAGKMTFGAGQTAAALKESLAARGLFLFDKWY